MNVFEYSIAGVFFDAGGMVYNVRHPSFGADGGGEVDDTDAILAALRAAPEGATVVVPHGRYRVSATVAVDRRIRLTGGGTLVAADGADLDQVLLVAADHAQVDNLRVDQRNVTGNAGRGEGVRVGGTSTRVQNVHVLGEGAAGGSLSNGFLVGGARNLLIGCTVENAGYAGFRNDGDFNRYYAVQARAVGRSDSVRGFIHNGDARLLVLDGAHFHTDSSHAASVGILIDAGAGRELSHLVLRGTYSGTTGEETLKLAGVARADVSDSRFEGGPIQLAGGLGRVVLRDCVVDRGRVAFGASVIGELVLERVDVSTAARYALGDLVVSRL
ncbi:MAG: glycosyl hydrolase family 28-related protein, partial [Gemmatimonadota bacterium]